MDLVYFVLGRRGNCEDLTKRFISTKLAKYTSTPILQTKQKKLLGGEIKGV